MKSIFMKSSVLVAAGFFAGVGVSHFPPVQAQATAIPDMSKKKFEVFIDEVQKNFAFGDTFSGVYTKTVTMSDGTTRRITLTPMIHDGMQVVKFDDNDGHTYMSLNGTTTNGKLMVQVADVDTTHAQLKSEGWRQ